MSKFPLRSRSPSAFSNNINNNGHPHHFAAGIQIIQYRSYQRDIFIYHVREHLLPLLTVCRALQSQSEYRGKLTGFDPIRYFPVVEGDQIPTGCIEAAYMPSILHENGSALALRSNSTTGKVEWFIFSGPVHDTFLSRMMYSDSKWHLQRDPEPDDPLKIFNLVGYAEKGLKTRRVRGANAEHKGWHDSLCSGEQGRVTLKLTWKGYGNDLKAEMERRDREVGKTGAERGAEDLRQKASNASSPPQPPQKPAARLGM